MEDNVSLERARRKLQSALSVLAEFVAYAAAYGIFPLVITERASDEECQDPEPAPIITLDTTIITNLAVSVSMIQCAEGVDVVGLIEELDALCLSEWPFKSAHSEQDLAGLQAQVRRFMHIAVHAQRYGWYPVKTHETHTVYLSLCQALAYKAELTTPQQTTLEWLRRTPHDPIRSYP